ncbi:DnaB-like helicase C terminal domain [Dolichospermum phage Dfl-JY45]
MARPPRSQSPAPTFRGIEPSFSEDGLRIPPHNIQAEQAVLGGLMLSAEAFDRVADSLHATDFYLRSHQLIYASIIALAKSGASFDAVTVGEWFEARGEAELIGGGAYIVELSSTTPSAANLEAYAAIVRDKALLRRLIDESFQITQLAYNPVELSAKEITEQAEQRIYQVAQHSDRARASHTSMRPLAREIFRAVSENFQNKRDMLGLPMGFVDLDRMLKGMRETDLIIVAARPAMGKTSFALQIADYASSTTGKVALVFSMEMSSTQLGYRMVSMHSRISSQSVQTGNLSEEDWPRLTQALEHMTASPLVIDDTPALSPLDLRAKARRIAREKGGIGLIVIDYLQLMQVPGNKENRATEISEISRSLKALAKEMNIPIVALSQLNRSLETRADKRPVMADLRESGAIEQDADLILFIYRDDYYHADSEDKGLAEIIVGKFRHGPTGTVKLAFSGQATRFDNLAHSAYP